jgi:hypothetical protein
MHRPEVLAPAGDADALRAAVRAGADAVYFGLQGFNARARAGNFDAAGLTATMRYLHEHGARGYVTLNTLVFDFGTLYQVSERGLRIGASLSNFGTQGRFSGRDLAIVYDGDPTRYGDNGALPADIYTDAFDVPTLFRVGVGMPFRLGPQADLRLAVDAFHPSDNTEGMSAGAELDLVKRLSLRAGWQDAFQQDSEVGLTLGGGIRGKLDVYGYRVDYGWADHKRLGGTHRVTIGMQF